MSRPFRVLPDTRTRLYGAIGLRLVDDLTGGPPLGPTRFVLEIADGAGGWRSTNIRPTVTDSGFVSYTGLGRRQVTSGPPRRYRTRLDLPPREAPDRPFYRPHYRINADAIEFDVHPYNDTNPPTVVATAPQNVVLLPAAHYPFDGGTAVLRGRVVDASGAAVADVLVTQGIRERVLTDERGEFGLPLRWVPNGVPTAVDATDHRTGRTGSISVTLPGALANSQTITFP